MKFNCQVSYVEFHAKLAPKLFQSLSKLTDFPETARRIDSSSVCVWEILRGVEIEFVLLNI